MAKRKNNKKSKAVSNAVAPSTNSVQSAQKQSLPPMMIPSHIQTMQIYELMLPLCGKTELKFQGIEYSKDRIDIDKNMLDDYDERGYKVEEKKSETPEEKKKGFCSFGTVMIVTVVTILVLLVSLKFGEESFFYQQKYDTVDFYSVLNVTDRKAPFKDIKRMYRKAVIRWHPDRNPDCEDCAKKMSDINDAYVILSNPETRSFHDQHGVKPPESMIQAAKEKHGGRGRRM